MTAGAAVYGFSQYANGFDGVGGQGIGYGEAGKGYTNNGMSLNWELR
jgi:hypothetical protein